jgi:hypothetical protein
MYRTPSFSRQRTNSSAAFIANSRGIGSVYTDGGPCASKSSNLSHRPCLEQVIIEKNDTLAASPNLSRFVDILGESITIPWPELRGASEYQNTTTNPRTQAAAFASSSGDLQSRGLVHFSARTPGFSGKALSENMDLTPWRQSLHSRGAIVHNRKLGFGIHGFSDVRSIELP